MKDLDRFLELLRDELGLPLSAQQLDMPFAELEAWDSVHLLRLIGVMEETLGRPVSVPALARAGSLREVFEAVGVR